MEQSVNLQMPKKLTFTENHDPLQSPYSAKVLDPNQNVSSLKYRNAIYWRFVFDKMLFSGILQSMNI